MKLSLESAESLYKESTRQIKAAIINGHLNMGEEIPSVQSWQLIYM